jgi:hypothetical protein
MTQDSQAEALQALADKVARVVGGSLHLGQGDPGFIDPLKVAADYATVECDFDGYAAIDPLPAALAAYQDGANRYSQQIPTQQFNYVDGVGHVANVATFAWIETAGNVVVQAFTLPEGGVSFDNNLCSLPIDLKFSENTNPVG